MVVRGGVAEDLQRRGRGPRNAACGRNRAVTDGFSGRLHLDLEMVGVERQHAADVWREGNFKRNVVRVSAEIGDVAGSGAAVGVGAHEHARSVARPRLERELLVRLLGERHVVDFDARVARHVAARVEEAPAVGARDVGVVVDLPDRAAGDEVSAGNERSGHLVEEARNAALHARQEGVDGRVGRAVVARFRDLYAEDARDGVLPRLAVGGIVRRAEERQGPVRSVAVRPGRGEIRLALQRAVRVVERGVRAGGVDDGRVPGDVGLDGIGQRERRVRSVLRLQVEVAAVRRVDEHRECAAVVTEQAVLARGVADELEVDLDFRLAAGEIARVDDAVERAVRLDEGVAFAAATRKGGRGVRAGGEPAARVERARHEILEARRAVDQARREVADEGAGLPDPEAVDLRLREVLEGRRGVVRRLAEKGERARAACGDVCGDRHAPVGRHARLERPHKRRVVDHGLATIRVGRDARGKCSRVRHPRVAGLQRDVSVSVDVDASRRVGHALSDDALLGGRRIGEGVIDFDLKLGRRNDAEVDGVRAVGFHVGVVVEDFDVAAVCERAGAAGARIEEEGAGFGIEKPGHAALHDGRVVVHQRVRLVDAEAVDADAALVVAGRSARVLRAPEQAERQRGGVGELPGRRLVVEPDLLAVLLERDALAELVEDDGALRGVAVGASRSLAGIDGPDARETVGRVAIADAGGERVFAAHVDRGGDRRLGIVRVVVEEAGLRVLRRAGEVDEREVELDPGLGLHVVARVDELRAVRFDVGVLGGGGRRGRGKRQRAGDEDGRDRGCMVHVRCLSLEGTGKRKSRRDRRGGSRFHGRSLPLWSMAKW